MATTGRILSIGPTDNTSDQRTPRQPLWLIPPEARTSFAPYVTHLPAVSGSEANLTRLAPGRPRAEGDAIRVTGRLLDRDGEPLKQHLIEIWNANKHGRYTHIEDHSGLQLDPNFLGLGRTLSDDEGRYEFWTICPGAYLARPDIGRWRPKHIHLSVIGGASRLITQMYFPDDPYNDTDPMRILMGDDFNRNVAKKFATPDSDFVAGYEFDMVIGGRNAIYYKT